MFARLFLSHPQSVGETYLEHQRMAFSFAGPLLLAGLACLHHAIIPGLCERTASSKIEMLHNRLVVNRRGPAKNFASFESKDRPSATAA